MDNKQRLKNVLTAALLMMVTVVILNNLTIRGHSLLDDIFGYTLGYYVAIIALPALIFAIAATPGFFLLKYTQVSHSISLSLAAAVLAFCFTFTFITAASLAGRWVVSIIQLIEFTLIAAAYLLGDAVFNRWAARFRYKVLAVIGVSACTLILDRIFATFY